MSTGGALGFHINGIDKIAYNHDDSYPGGLGVDVLNFLKGIDLMHLKEVAANIQLVHKDSIPSTKQIKECAPWTDTTVNAGSTNNWYCLLRKSQGNLQAYMQGLKYMRDSQEFLRDSLFCEYAYIINLDDNVLEFYAGFNQHARPRMGRYASLQRKQNPNEYFGVARLAKIPLSLIIEAPDAVIDDIVQRMVQKAESFYKRRSVAPKKVNAAM